jgi:LmbE family N-acetylglucosaminyl deacetylase
MPHLGNFRTLSHGLAVPAWAREAYEGEVGARPERRRAAPSAGSFVTIMAHSDDDLLFVNPDLRPAVSSGLSVRTIVLTADEYNGVPGEMSREELAATLRQGTRCAYESLSGVSGGECGSTNWRIETMVVADRIIEVNTLIPVPTVQLYWLSLPDGGDDLHLDALANLWEDPDYETTTIVPTGGPVDEEQTYTGDRVYSVLLGLLNLFQPTVIRVQDPVPDRRHRADHGDHVAATAFAQLAARTYGGPGASGFALLTRYRCYNTSESPENVPQALLTPKTTAYRAYNTRDPLTGPGFDANLSRNYQRFPVSSGWAVRDGAGTLHVVVAAADDVIAWRQTAGATTWTGPVSLVSGHFAPGVAVASGGDGRIQLAVLNLDTAGVHTSTQTAPGGGFGAWTTIGAPGDDDPLYGAPAMGANADGGMEMYALDASGGLSNAFQAAPGGTFDGWYPVGGGDEVMGQPTVLTAPNGLTHVFADGNGSIRHWRQPKGGSTTPDGTFPTIESVATPAVVVEGSGRARLLTREYTDGAVGTGVENTAGGTWSGLTHIGGQGGVGPVAAVRSGGTAPRVLVFARNDAYGVSVSGQASGGTFGAWQDLGGYCEIGPAAVLDNAGRVRLLAVGADGRLHERRQSAAGPDAAFDAWQVVGA